MTATGTPTVNTKQKKKEQNHNSQQRITLETARSVNFLLKLLLKINCQAKKDKEVNKTRNSLALLISFFLLQDP